MRTLQGKSVVITGAASGIGEALAHASAARGARLLLADIDAAGLDRVVSVLKAKGVECSGLVSDTGDEAVLYALAQEAQTRLGGADVLINNAGVGLMAPIEKLRTMDAQWLMNINFWGVVHGCQAFIPQMRQRPDAVLVNISSIFAMVSIPTQGIYNASKAAVRGFSDALREELRGSGLDVLCVHPGGIKTNIANSARITDVSMVADSDQEMRDNFTNLARTTPQQAAAVILRAIETRKTRVLIGADARFMDWMFRLFPAHASHWLSNIGQWMRRRNAAKAGSTSTQNNTI
ncbi:MAG: SDR family NAD(P)-dependent oxidoreductase [Rhodoferax sp.]|nr:SDR family NAD(P)-dependent oxidoreductase [Rhodoferax sp.]